MFITTLKLFAIGMMPVIVSILLRYLDHKTKILKRFSFWTRQIIFGIIFGVLSCLGTEFGVSIQYGAVINVRDVAPVCAGLIFGAPAGIIAGIIGGVERYFAIYWGAGTFTRFACSFSTIMAGVIAALFRRFVFKNHHGKWYYGFAVGVIVEVFHMIMIFLTNLSNVEAAITLVKICTIPMTLVNATSVMLSHIGVAIVSKEELIDHHHPRTITYQIQLGLLASTLLAFFLVTGFTYGVFKGQSTNKTDSILEVNIRDVTNDINDTSKSVTTVASYRHIGETGYVVVFDSNGTSISSNLNHRDNAIDISLLKDYKELTTFEYLIEGVDSYVMTSTVNDYYVVAVYPMKEANREMEVSVYLTSLLEVIVFAIMYILIYLMIDKIMVQKVDKVSNALHAIANGKLAVRVKENESFEFHSLSRDINVTVNTLNALIRDASARIDKELDFAKKIQHSALPNTFPPYPNYHEFDIYASMNTAKEVGGDFYDYYLIDSRHLAILIADVSGKGIPAAMFMMTAKTIIKGLAETGLDVNDILTQANHKLCEGNDAEMFVTVWMGIVDLDTGHIEYANAGHNPPIVCRSDGNIEYLHGKAGFVLAGMEGMIYKKQEIQLEPGDQIYLYTDGVTEACNKEKELYGEDRLINVIMKIKDKKAIDVCNSVLSDVHEYTNGAEQSDDITMLSFKYHGIKQQRLLDVVASIKNIPYITDYINEVLESNDCSMKSMTAIDIAIDEIVSNIANYGYVGKEGMVKIRIEISGDPLSAIITFIDTGIEYNPLAKEDPDTTLPLEERGVGGLGIYMVKKSMDELTYEYNSGRNIFTIKKKLK